MRKDWQWTLLAIFSVQCEFEEKRDCVSWHSNRNICLIQFKGEQFDECRSRVLRTYLIWFRPIPLKFSIYRPLYFVETSKSMWAHTENVRKQETKSTKNEEWMRDVVELMPSVLGCWTRCLPIQIVYVWWDSFWKITTNGFGSTSETYAAEWRAFLNLVFEQFLCNELVTFV